MLGCVLDSRQSVLDPRNTVNCLTYLSTRNANPFMGYFWVFHRISGLMSNLTPDDYTQLRVFFTP